MTYLMSPLPEGRVVPMADAYARCLKAAGLATPEQAQRFGEEYQRIVEHNDRVLDDQPFWPWRRRHLIADSTS